MIYKKQLVCVAGAFFLALNSTLLMAGTLQLEYKSFYSHLKKLNDEELGLLQFAFGFQHVTQKKLCEVKSVLITTDKKDIPVEVRSEGRFVLPSEKALKLADAKVIVVLTEQNNQCDLSVKLQITPEDFTNGVNGQRLTVYYQAFEAFFEEMGGMLSFMMPSPEGLLISLENQNMENAYSETVLQQALPGQYRVAAQDISKIDFELIGVKSITAWMP